jgi:hypothetical protein
MTLRETIEVLTILGQLGMAFLAIPTCLVGAGIILVKLVQLIGEEVR